MKRLLSLTALLFLAVASFAYDFKVNGIYYKITSSTSTSPSVSVSYMFTVQTGTSSYVEYVSDYKGSVTIPETVTYNGTTYKVTGIGDHAFYKRSGLISITIPSSVTEIGESAFYGCSGLTSITIPSSITTIGSSAFSSCSGLTSITIPSSVTSIGNGVFSYCTGLTSIQVDAGNSKYDSRDNCNAIIETSSNTLITGCKTTAIPSSVTSIGSEAFSGCSGLTSVVIPFGVTSIGNNAFNNCSGLTSVVISSSVTSIGNYAFRNCSITGITIPESVTSIGVGAFYGCSVITSITIPSKVTTIGDYAFSGCKSITSIIIPSSVTTIGSKVFNGCTDLIDVLLNSNAVASNTYSSSNSLKNIFGTQVKTYTIGDNVTTIGNYAFSGCSELTSITIPSSVTTLGEGAFSGCSGLTSITIPSSITTIGSSAFLSCSGLTSITIPSSVTSIGSYAFPESVTLYTNSGSKTHFNLLKKGYTKVYDIESKKYIVPYLSSTSTQTTLQISLVNRISEFVYTYGGKQITSDIVGTVTGLRPDASRSIYVQVSFDGQSYTMENTFSTRSISPSVNSTTSASSLQATGSYIIGDANVTKNVIKCNGKEVEGKSISVNGLNPNTSYDVEYTVTVAYGDNNQYTATYTGTKTVKTQELTLTTEQPKVVSMGNVVVSATTNVDPEEKNVGFEWRRTDWTSDFASNSGSAVVYGNTMEGYIRNMNTDKLWKYRAYYLSDDGTYYYGDWVGLDASNTSYFEPTVHTYADISTSGKVALIRGYVLNGTDKVTVQGFKYWKTANKSNSLDIAMEAKPQAAVVSVPAYAITETVAIVGAGQQLMNATLENLDYGSTYQCVAFATTSENETFYGEVQTFTTEAAPTGIEGVKEDAGSSKPVTVAACYDINGKQLSAPQKGLNIIKMSDGTTRKVVR